MLKLKFKLRSTLTGSSCSFHSTTCLFNLEVKSCGEKHSYSWSCLAITSVSVFYIQTSTAQRGTDTSIAFFPLLKNRLYILKKFQVHSNIDQKVQRFLIYPLYPHLHTHGFLHVFRWHFFKHRIESIVWMYLFLYPATEGHLGCLKVWAVMNNSVWT